MKTDDNLTCIHHLLEYRAVVSPGNPAVCFINQTIDYETFNRLANQLSHHLIVQGVKPGDLVGIAMERSMEMVISIFAILKAGAAYVPIEPSYPAERIGFLLQDASIRIVLTQERFVEVIKAPQTKPIIPDIHHWLFHHLPVENPGVTASPSDLAYILYTSGSTGKPKGVLIEHHSVVNLVQYIQNTYPIEKDDVVLLKSPYTFDGSVWELFGWMLPGASLRIAEPGVEKDPARLAKTISENKVSFAFFVSSLLSVFLDYIDAVNAPDALSGLKWVSVGGEVVSTALVRRFHEKTHASGTGLFNVYGPTETTVYATTYLCSRNKKYDKIPVGKPVTHDYVYILDENLREVVAGEEGEICIGGEGVGRGYFNRPELDAERFVPNPFRPGEKMYRTGDIGRYMPDGNVDFIGRRDFQVKLRGLRIELGEIETALMELELFKDVAVVFTKDPFGDDCLAAYLLTAQHKLLGDEIYSIVKQDDKQMISERLKAYLPDFMVPEYFINCQSFPLNENGKTDRRQLPALSQFNWSGHSEIYITENATEKKLLEIWQSVLGKTNIGRNNDFFALGGHSLKSFQVITAVIKEFNVDLPLKIFYNKPTIPLMAGLIDRELQKRTSETTHLIPAVKGIHKDAVSQQPADSSYFPLTGMQKEMWVINNLDPSGLKHNIQVEFEISGEPDVLQLISSLKNLVNSEEIFRSTFPFHQGQPVQKIHDNTDLDIAFVDLSAFTPIEREEKYRKMVFDHGNNHFDLNRLPLLAFKLIRLDENQYRLLLAIHHIIFDGWSLQLFVSRLKATYVNHGMVISKPAFFNRDYVSYIRKQLDEGLAEKQLNYWKSVFTNIPGTLALPLKDNAISHAGQNNGDRIWWSLTPETTRDFEHFCARLNSTPFVVFLASWKVALSKITGQSDMVVGSPFANRKLPVVADIIGYYTNMVPLRSVLNPEMTFSQLIAHCNQSAMNAFENADLPFGELIKTLKINQHPGSYPLYQVIFVLQNWPEIDTTFPGFLLKQKEIGNNTSKIDITLNAEKVGDQYVCWFEYDLDKFDESLIREMVQSFRHILKTAIKNPELSVDELINNKAEIVPAKWAKTCVLIGETSLLQQCGDILLNQDFRIKAVISPDKSCQNWAKSRHICQVSGYENYPQILKKASPYGYLFSIVNSIILPQDVLHLAKVSNINYHDALLPAYAGRNATSWAIINQEKIHGITWHLIDEGTDTGDILIQKSIDISRDTAFVVNAKCYEQAMAAFKELVTALPDQSYVSVKQDVTKRTYFGLHQKPFAGGCIDLRKPAYDSECLVRGLNRGKIHCNHLAIPKVLIYNKLYVITEAVAGKSNVTVPIGSVVSISEKELSIATSDGILKITGLHYPNGQKVNPLMDLYPLKTTDLIENPGDDYLALVDNYFSQYGRYERFWNWQLAASELLSPDKSVNQPSDYQYYNIDISSLKQIAQEDIPAIIFLTCAIHSDEMLCSAGITNPGLLELYYVSKGVYSPILPFIPDEPDFETYRNTIHHISEQYHDCLKKGSYPADLIARIPALAEKFKEVDHPFYQYLIVDGEMSTGELKKHQPYAAIFQVTDEEIHIYIPNNHSLKDNYFIHRLNNMMSQAEGYLDIAFDELDILTETERNIHQLLNPDFSLPQYKNISALFSEIALKHPDNIAIEFENQKLTYRYLNNTAEKAAGYITSRFPGTPIIPVCLDRTPELLTAILGILQAGRAYLPLDPKYPVERISGILKDSGCNAVISDFKYAGLFHSDIQVVQITEILNAESRYEAVPVQIQADNPAYIIYTSGTTGKPKGVVISNRALSVFTQGCMDRYALNQHDRVLQFASISFDASVEEIFPTLCTGATLVLRSEEDIASNARFMKLLHRSRITLLDLPTAFWNQLVSYIYSESIAPPSSLKTLIIGGELANTDYVKKWFSTGWSEIRLFNTYGPTETTVVATSYLIRRSDSGGDIPIGKPVAGAVAKVLNRFRQPAIPGKTGRLFIGGHVLSDGYLNHPEMTTRNFIHLNGSNVYGIYYDTGDLVKLTPDGNLIFIGRNDTQLKIRGFRVEPEELKNAVESLPQVIECVVVPVETAQQTVSLAAYVVAEDNGMTSVDIKRSLKNLLPDYMIPVSVQLISSIPLTINGKVDVKMLPEPEVEKKIIEESALPVTGTEKLLFSIWSKHLNNDHFSIDENYFELGGHSLIAVSIIGDIEKELHTDIPLASLFSFPTVRSLAKAIEEKEQEALWRPLVVIKKGKPGKMPLFLIHGGGLNVLLFISLSKHMNEDQPIYGIQAHGLDGKSEPHEDLDDILNHYISEIETVNPEGPYALAGYSIGGLIAFELGCRLVKTGRKVAFIGMFDTVASSNEPFSNHFINVYRKIKLSVMQVAFMLFMITFHPVKTIPVKYRWYKKKFAIWLSGKQSVNRQDLMNLPDHLISVAKANLKALSGLRLSFFPGTLYLFRAKNRSFYVEDKKFLGWSKYVDKVEVVQLNGDHSRIFAPPVDQEFAGHLQKCLDKVDPKL